jgi:hypothetical protein
MNAFVYRYAAGSDHMYQMNSQKPFVRKNIRQEGTWGGQEIA